MKLFLLLFAFTFSHFIFSQSTDDSLIIWQKNHYQDTVAPHFLLKDVNGKIWNSDSLRGKIVVLNFWSIYCPGCFTELPELNKIPETFSSDSVVFISVLFEKDVRADSIIAKNKFNYHLVNGGLPVMGDFYNNCFPTHIIIDRNGIIRYNVCGVLTKQFLTTEIKNTN